MFDLVRARRLRLRLVVLLRLGAQIGGLARRLSLRLGDRGWLRDRGASTVLRSWEPACWRRWRRRRRRGSGGGGLGCGPLHLLRGESWRWQASWRSFGQGLGDQRRAGSGGGSCQKLPAWRPSRRGEHRRGRRDEGPVVALADEQRAQRVRFRVAGWRGTGRGLELAAEHLGRRAAIIGNGCGPAAPRREREPGGGRGCRGGRRRRKRGRGRGRGRERGPGRGRGGRCGGGRGPDRGCWSGRGPGQGRRPGRRPGRGHWWRGRRRGRGTGPGRR